MQGTKVDLLIPCVISYNLIDEGLQVIIESLQQLDCLELKHFLNRDIIEVCISSHKILLGAFSRLLIPLEDNDVELAIVSFGNFSEQLDAFNKLLLH